MQVLCLLQFYIQDSFLDEVVAGLPGREFRMDLAGKKTIKFYSRMAASIMLADQAFFNYVLQVIGSRSMEAEERCDLASVMGTVFETFGQEAGDKGISRGAWAEFAWALLAVMASPEEQEEMKVSCAAALRRALRNPDISVDIDPELAKAASAQLSAYEGALTGI